MRIYASVPQLNNRLAFQPSEGNSVCFGQNKECFVLILCQVDSYSVLGNLQTIKLNRYAALQQHFASNLAHIIRFGQRDENETRTSHSFFQDRTSVRKLHWGAKGKNEKADLAPDEKAEFREMTDILVSSYRRPM